MLIVVVLLPFSCVQFRKVWCRSSRVQTDAVQPSVVNKLHPERSQRFVRESWRVRRSCDRLIPANQPYSTIFSSVFSCQQCCPASSCSSPISSFHARIHAHHHHQSTPNASDTSDPCTKCTLPSFSNSRISGIHQLDACTGCSCKKCLPMINCLLYGSMHAHVYCLSWPCTLSIWVFVPFSQG